MIIAADTLTDAAAYKLLIGSIVPRPIAWVSTVARGGTGNIAPISFFTAVSRRPPKISLTLQPRSDGRTRKDTLNNIVDTEEFVVNIATLIDSDAVHRSAQEFSPDEDEFDEIGLERVPSVSVKAPRIASAPISYECRLDRLIQSGENDNVVWGEIVQFHIRDDLYSDSGRIDTAGMLPIGRLAAEYTSVNNVFTTPLPEDVLAAAATSRMRRLDDLDDGFSPLDTPAWSPSGSTNVAAAVTPVGDSGRRPRR